MEIYQLKTFIAVATEGSLSRAAERVFVGLPAVSAQIRALEDELGVQLFERMPKGMRLTDAGARLLNEARAVLDAAYRMKQTATEIRGELWGCANVGVLTDSLDLRVGEIVLELAKRHPKVDVKLQRDVSARVVKRVASGELDGGFALASQPPSGLSCALLASVDLVVTLPAGFAEVSAGRLDLAELAQLPWIVSTPECALHTAMLGLFKPLGQQPRTSFVVDSEGALRSMVASGLGAGIMRLPEALDAVDKGECTIWPHWKGLASLFWVSAALTQTRPIAAAVRDTVLESWQSGTERDSARSSVACSDSASCF